MARFETLLVERDGPVGTVTLNRPDRLNAIDGAMGRELPAAWKQLDDDAQVVVIVVTGAGRGFCTGLDVRERARATPSPEQRGDLHSQVRLTAIHCAVWKPVITAVNGVCAGGGLHFVADSDITICGESATFLDPHVSVGQVSALEPIGLVRRVPFEVVMRMALMGREERLDADTALRCGLVSEVVADDRLQQRARELAGRIAHSSPAALRATKRALWESLDHGLGEALENGWQILQDHYRHPDFEEGPRAFAEGRPPRWASPSATRSAAAP
ncbi:MAG: enoyl-CoA hydratase/isomerase family protein [Chloroflexi bacterium]|nr:MAG: enoyl-CoA hydratase/isomerase family protein [Chloroflexota bacterium]